MAYVRPSEMQPSRNGYFTGMNMFLALRPLSARGTHFDWFFRITNFRCSNESNWNCFYPKADYAPTVANPHFEAHREELLASTPISS
ncbi:hypothetical protein NC651_010609 [Populus alba x Populus x berolinensis]|nr:hypothetical protein NC651_010609 [Populus alba x Populus x berolinensis]